MSEKDRVFQDIETVIEKVVEIWGTESIPSPEFLVFLLLEQIEEIDESEYDRQVLKKELCDMISISIQYLKHLGFDPEKELLNRLESRHEGKQDSIKVKYVRRWLKRLNDLEVEREDPILDERPTVGDY